MITDGELARIADGLGEALDMALEGNPGIAGGR